MATNGGPEAYGHYVDAEDILGKSTDDKSEEREGDTEDESETESESESGSESESETETGSESESGSGSDSETESETESESETEAESSEVDRSTGVGDGIRATGGGDAKRSTTTECSSTPRSEHATSVGGDAEIVPQNPVGGDVETAPQPPAGDSKEAAAPTPCDDDVAGPADMQPAVDEAPAPPASSWSLPPAPSRSGSRDGILPSPHQTSPSGDSRAAGSDTVADAQGETTPLSLPPALSRNSSRENSSRKSSHHEASTSGLGHQQSSGSLPPINLRGSTQPSRKGSNSSSQAAADAKRSQAPSPKQGSPTRNPIAAPRYFKPPPPPPPPPKPKPRERHDVSAVDPVFLQTAVYRTVPNVGRVYDWRLQHEVNAALSKQRKQQVQMEKVLEAARVQLQVREANERAFQEWVAAKEQEKQAQHQQNRRIAYVTSVYQNLVKEDPVERKTRESLWVSNFAYAPSDSVLPRPLPRARVSDDAERFRM